MDLNQTPSSNRLHIGIYGATNSGKSALMNAILGQEVSIVAEHKGTTTDPVRKAMELKTLGPVVFLDTAGFDDDTPLGEKRLQKTLDTLNKTELAILIINGMEEDAIQAWRDRFTEKKIGYLFVINKIDILEEGGEMLAQKIQNTFNRKPILVSSLTGEGIEDLKDALLRVLPEEIQEETLTGRMVNKDDVVLLVMPQDIQAPKGRLILPQVQTIRDILDKKAIVLSTTTETLDTALQSLKNPPKLIITDSQVFLEVYHKKPKESLLTSFSVLFAAYKGDLKTYLKGAETIPTLTEQSKILIAECCTHAPMQEDIGRVKIPRILRRKFGEGIHIDVVGGEAFPKDLSQYDLIIQCGGCMFHRKFVMSRITLATEKQVPITNYGIFLAYAANILDKIVLTDEPKEVML